MTDSQCKEFNLENLTEKDKIIYDTIYAITGNKAYAEGVIKTSSPEKYGNGKRDCRQINREQGDFIPPSPGYSDWIHSSSEILIRIKGNSYL